MTGRSYIGTLAAQLFSVRLGGMHEKLASVALCFEASQAPSGQVSAVTCHFKFFFYTTTGQEKAQLHVLVA
jgi:hypothetical protein